MSKHVVPNNDVIEDRGSTPLHSILKKHLTSLSSWCIIRHALTKIINMRFDFIEAFKRTAEFSSTPQIELCIKEREEKKLETYARYNERLLLALNANDNEGIAKLLKKGIADNSICYTHFGISVSGGQKTLKEIERSGQLEKLFGKYIETITKNGEINSAYFSREFVESILLCSTSRTAGSKKNKSYQERLSNVGVELLNGEGHSWDFFKGMQNRTAVEGDKRGNMSKVLCEAIGCDFEQVFNNKSVDIIMRLGDEIICFEEKTVNGQGGHQDRVIDEIVDVVNRKPIMYDGIAIKWGAIMCGETQRKLFTTDINSKTKFGVAHKKIVDGLENCDSYIFNWESLGDFLRKGIA